MSAVKYSIVIPTRNRARYLQHTLATCLGPGRSDVEIVVSDNSDADQAADIAELVRQSDSTAVRYVRPPEPPLGMSANWEFALTHIRGEYVIVIGDDDALLPSTLPALDRIFASTTARIVSWPRADYGWPDHVRPDLQDRIGFPLVDDRFKYDITPVDGHAELRRVMRHPAQYHLLPVLYHSAIRRDAVDLLPPDGSPRFAGCAPDVYSGIVLASRARHYVRLRTPLSISGACGKSTGTAYTRIGNRSPIVSDFGRQNDRSNIRCHPSVPDLPVLSALFAESFAKYKDRSPAEAAPFAFDTDKYARVIITEICHLPVDADERSRLLERALDYYKHRSDLVQIVERHKDSLPQQGHTPAPGFLRGQLALDGRAFGISDVAGAAALCENILAYDVARFGQPAPSRGLRERIEQLVPPLLWEQVKRIKQAYL